jgi:hypothetical protein
MMARIRLVSESHGSSCITYGVCCQCAGNRQGPLGTWTFTTVTAGLNITDLVSTPSTLPLEAQVDPAPDVVLDDTPEMGWVSWISLAAALLPPPNTRNRLNGPLPLLLCSYGLPVRARYWAFNCDSGRGERVRVSDEE